MKVLVVGGAGYIGSHTCVDLVENGYDIVVVDNFSNSKPEAIDHIKEIIGKDFPFYEVDACDKEALEEVFKKEKIDAVIHFAGYKAVGESVQKPLMYYHNNLLSTIVLCELMDKYDCKKIVFSSSATVYGKPDHLPITEDFPLSTTNPYGTTKLMIEQILKDLYTSDPTWSICVLRYFNPIGAHESGLIGEDPNGIPNNLMPYIVKVANKELKELGVFGDDYDTPDGTGVRDYIHVCDLAHGHSLALNKLGKEEGIYYYNLGTGNGYSVLDIVNAFQTVNGVDVPYVIKDRRPGDIAACYADPTKAYEELGFKAQYTLDDMCKSAWNYVTKNK